MVFFPTLLKKHCYYSQKCQKNTSLQTLSSQSGKKRHFWLMLCVFFPSHTVKNHTQYSVLKSHILSAPTSAPISGHFSHCPNHWGKIFNKSFFKINFSSFCQTVPTTLGRMVLMVGQKSGHGSRHWNPVSMICHAVVRQ